MIYIFVFILAGLGAILRWQLSDWFNLVGFPWGTLTVNTLGCLAMGCLLSQLTQQPIPPWGVALMVGFLGAFTTFSAYAMESIHLMNEGLWLRASLYIFLSNSLGILAYWCGLKLSSHYI